jgi:hypothetical protein
LVFELCGGKFDVFRFTPFLHTTFTLVFLKQHVAAVFMHQS